MMMAVKKWEGEKVRQWVGHQLSKSRNCARDQLSDDDDDGDDDDGDDDDDGKDGSDDFNFNESDSSDVYIMMVLS